MSALVLWPIPAMLLEISLNFERYHCHFKREGENTFPFLLVLMSLLQKFIPRELSVDALKFLIHLLMEVGIFRAGP